MEQSTLLQIAEEFGSPIYVYDAHKIEDQYKRLTQAFSKVKNLKIHYAAKALTNISVLKFVSKLGAALDTVSIQESGGFEAAGARKLRAHARSRFRALEVGATEARQERSGEARRIPAIGSSNRTTGRTLATMA